MKKIYFSRIALPFLLLIFLGTPAMASPARTKTMSILVYPFENNGDKQYSWISAGLEDWIINDLRGIKELTVISTAERKKIMAEAKFILSGLAAEETMVKVGRLSGADIIFAGSYRVSGKSIRAVALLLNVATGKTESSATLAGSLGKIFTLQDKVVLSLLSQADKTNLSGVNQVRIAKTELKKIEEKPRPPKTAAYTLYAKGLELRDTNPQEALGCFTKALGVEKNYVDALIMAGFTAGGSLGLFAEASGYLTQADTILKSRGAASTTDYAALMHTIGIVSQAEGDLDRARQYFAHARQTGDRLGWQDTADYAGLLVNIGAVYEAEGDLDRARDYYLDALQTGGKLGLLDTPGYAGLLVQIGNVYDAQGDPYHALGYYLHSRQIRDKLGLQDTAGYAGLLVDIGILHFVKDDLDRALEYYRASQQLRDKLGLQDTAGYAGLMMNIGNVYGSQGDLDRAMRYYLDAQQTWDRLGLRNTTVYAGLMLSMGRIYEEEENRWMAGRCYRDAYDSYVRAGYTGPMKDRALGNARRLGY